MNARRFFGKYPLRAFHKLFRGYWFLFHPSFRGSKVVLVHDGKILCVRHTYNPRYWTFPGGGLKNGEDAEAGARREVREELGISLGGLSFLGVIANNTENKNDFISVYFSRLSDDRVTKDDLEIGETRWFPENAMPELGPGARKVFEMYQEHAKKH